MVHLIRFRLLDRRSTRCAHNKVVIKLAVSFSNILEAIEQYISSYIDISIVYIEVVDSNLSTK